MNLYDVALSIFLKRSRTDYVNDSTRKGFESDIRQSIDVARLFIAVVEQDQEKNKKPSAQLELPFPEETI